MPITELLAQTPIFEQMPVERIDTLITSAPIREKKVKKGETILSQGAVYEDLYIILEGQADGTMVDPSGKEVHVESFLPPAPLAAAIFFARNRRLPVTVVAKNDARIAIIPRQTLTAMLMEDEQLLTNFLATVSDKAVFLSRRLSFMSFKSIRSKLAHYLMTLPLKKGGIIMLPETIEKLATYFGVTRPSLSRVLKELADKGILKHERKTIRVLNQEALIALAEEG